MGPWADLRPFSTEIIKRQVFGELDSKCLAMQKLKFWQAGSVKKVSCKDLDLNK